MEIEELWKHVEAYKKLVKALRNCSAETKEEVLAELEEDYQYSINI